MSSASRILLALALAALTAAHSLAQPAPPVGGTPPAGSPPAAGGLPMGALGGPPPMGIIGGGTRPGVGVGGPGFMGGGPARPGSSIIGGVGSGFPGMGVGMPMPGGGPMMVRQPLPVIDAKATLKDLLPHSPALTAVYTGEDLSLVPEVRYAAPPEKALTAEQWERRIGHHVASALHLNAKEEDGCLKAMLKGRHDLKGLPLVLGGACRTSGFKARAFKEQAALVKPLSPDQVAGSFIHARMGARHSHGKEPEKAEQYLQAHIAAVRQIGGAFEGKDQLAPVRYLTSAPRVEATRELARVAVFSPYKPAREEALEALSVRREADYAPVLAEALNYPWPQVARNAADAIVKLRSKELMPHLVAMLESPDPRAPRAPREEGEGEKKAVTARELVRINHHHNCLLCHSPGQRDRMSDETFLAEMPLPSETLSPPQSGYGSTQSPLLVRLDVTYLRQDFSVMQEVKDHGSWPSAQRFDFVVWKRELTKDEAAELRKRLTPREEGVLTPYQKAAVGALRELTGRDLEAKAEVWRKHLKLKS